MKTKLKQEDINQIINLYQTIIQSTHELAKQFKVGHKKISTILKDNKIPIKLKGAQIKHNKTNLIKSTKTKVYFSVDTELIAVCKKTGFTIKDPNNLSGKLTKHILDNYNDVIIPKNTFQRKKYEIDFNKKWYEEYFDIKEIDKQENRQCKLCEWTTIDLDNNSGCFENHIKNIHQTTLKNYLKQFPEDLQYHSIYYKKIIRNDELLKKNNFVICQICGEKMKVLSNTHLKEKHNLTAFEYKMQYSNDIMNKNLTIKTSERLATYNLSDTIKRKQTKPELEICNYLIKWGVEYKSSNRSVLNGKEIDILIDSIKIGIEFNGNIHHTEYFGGKDRNYHLNKTLEANNKGYKLIQIFSDEWKNNKELVINKLSHILGKSESIKIGARKCVIKEISKEDKNKFLEKYHIQGKDSSTIKLGAYYNNILVGVMTFKILKNKDYDLTRFATNYNYNISGLGSKLLNYFIKTYNPNSIISFADRRWTLDKNNNLYTKLGFKLVNILRPDYRYYHKNNHNEDREHKFGFRKQILVKKYPNMLDLSMTETEMIKKLGYDRIWDCGLFKYKMIIPDRV